MSKHTNKVHGKLNFLIATVVVAIGAVSYLLVQTGTIDPSMGTSSGIKGVKKAEKDINKNEVVVELDGEEIQEILNKSNSFNHVQALVINDTKIVSFEKRKGTKHMLSTIKKKKSIKNILIKMPKLKQDLRVDLPTIGLDTLKDCKKANIKGIVIKANQNIFLDKLESLKFANRNKIFVIAK